MAAYASLLSLMHTIQQIQHHPRPPISLDKTQVESLTDKITFLQEFLEGHPTVGYTREADDLEMRIADAAYAAEDVIESHIVNQVHAGSTSQGKEIEYQIHVGSTSHGENIKCFNCFRGLRKVRSQDKKTTSVDLLKLIRGMDPVESPAVVDQIQDRAISCVDLYEGLQKAVQDMDLIKKEVLETKEKRVVQYLTHRKSTPVRSSSTGRNVMVGFDDVLIEIMDKLTDGQLDRQIIPIVGMGGSGKTTLAKNVYQNQVVVQHFDILVWVTISQEYRVREILSKLVSKESKESEHQRDECVLGEKLHKRLSGRRYLIVLDDIWDIEVWDQLRKFFPDNNNGSRIMLTTRLSNMAYEVAGSNVIKMGLLDEDNSWYLFSKLVFGEEGCPFELEAIGKKIVKSCKGLPLSIVVVGGLLAKTEHKQEYWEHLGGNLISAVNSEDDESCLKILHMSYTQLPVYLKPCLLYIGVFKEDSDIRVSTLVKLWVAEGFLKPISGKNLEIVAIEYLKDLVDRNLILVQELGSTGCIKFCKIHDLLRDLCLREAQKEGFYNIMGQRSLPQSIKDGRRIVVLDSTSAETVDALKSTSLARSLIWNSDENVPPLDLRLLRILKAYDMYSPQLSGKRIWENKLMFVNSRYIAVADQLDSNFFSRFHILWNLQTLIFYSARYVTVPSEIWNMPQLKHVECESGLVLPEPPSGCNGRDDDIVLVNLQKLMRVKNFRCREETVKRIPNIKILKLHYEDDSSDYCLYNLGRLHKLESFHCAFSYSMPDHYLHKLTFPQSLKKLTLYSHLIQNWKGDIMDKIGSLPLLEKFRLIGGSFCQNNWETVEGQFRSLKFLQISVCDNLVYWTTYYTHFPRLEHLVLLELPELQEIPSDIGEIPTLRMIEVLHCSDGAVVSAREILREQEELGNEELQVKVTISRHRNKALMSMESTPNFQVNILR